jgi:hypothetical protein
MYKTATVFFSRDHVETIAHVILTIDRIDALLDDANSEPLAPSVKVALVTARAKPLAISWQHDLPGPPTRTHALCAVIPHYSLHL